MAACLNGDSSNHNNEVFEANKMGDTKDKILALTSYSSRLEEVLLALLKDQQMLQDRFDHEVQGINSKIDNVIRDGEKDKLEQQTKLSSLDNELSNLGQKIAGVQACRP